MRKLTREERISQFNAKHNGKYDYSLVQDDLTWDSKIKIICPTHGEFEQTVDAHRKSGCISCAGVRKKSKEERVRDAIRVHGNRYNYDLIPKDINAHTKVKIICSEHGEFACTMANHVNHGAGCPTCAGKKPKHYKHTIRRMIRVHGDKYIYPDIDDKVESSRKIPIECREHGIFYQRVHNHLAGKGCPFCSVRGFDPQKPGYVYKLHGDGIFKVGITNNIDNRIAGLIKSTPFNFSVGEIKYYEVGADAAKEERRILNSTESAGLNGFDGATEWRKL